MISTSPNGYLAAECKCFHSVIAKIIAQTSVYEKSIAYYDPRNLVSCKTVVICQQIGLTIIPFYHTLWTTTARLTATLRSGTFNNIAHANLPLMSSIASKRRLPLYETLQSNLLSVTSWLVWIFHQLGKDIGWEWNHWAGDCNTSSIVE